VSGAKKIAPRSVYVDSDAVRRENGAAAVSKVLASIIIKQKRRHGPRQTKNQTHWYAKSQNSKIQF
jgi:hypothetical protein